MRFTALAMLAAFAMPVLAQSDAVVINATRFPEDGRRLPASVTVLGAEDIQKSAARTLPELLSEQVGVTMKDFYGNNAASTAVDLRGFGATATPNTLVLVDGRRATDADLSGVQWAAIPLAAVERIELLRGLDRSEGAGAVNARAANAIAAPCGHRNRGLDHLPHHGRGQASGAIRHHRPGAWTNFERRSRVAGARISRPPCHAQRPGLRPNVATRADARGGRRRANARHRLSYRSGSRTGSHGRAVPATNADPRHGQANAWRSCGAARAGSTYRANRGFVAPWRRPANDIGVERSAARAPEQGAPRCQGIRVLPGIIGDRLAPRLDDWHDPGLVAFARDAQRRADRHYRPIERQCFGNAQASLSNLSLERSAWKGDFYIRMRYLTTAQDIGELGIIKSLCEANGIHCLFQDEHVSSLYPGVLDLCCQVMVDESDWERATTLISRLRLPIREVAPSS